MALPSEIFITLLVLNFIIITVKSIIVVALGKKILDARRSKEAVSLEFLFGVFMMILCLLISRIIFMVFDFVLTGFDTAFYVEYSRYWQIAAFISGLGAALLLFVLDRRIMEFKFKGIPTYLLVVGLIVTLLYPIHNMDDFRLVSAIGFLSASGTLIIIFVFGYLAAKTTGMVRRNAIMIMVGLILWGFGSSLVNAALLDTWAAMYGEFIRIPVYIISVGTKSVGLFVFAISATRLKV